MRGETAFVLPSLAGGGAERVALTLLADVHAAGWPASLILLDGEGPLRDLVPAGLTVVDLASPRLRQALPVLRRTLAERAPATVFSTLGHVNLALLALRPLLPARPRLILREANLPSASLPNAPHPRLTRLLYRALYRRADLLLCSSRRMAAELGGMGVPAARLALLPNPVDEAALRSRAVKPRREPGPGPRFIAAGRLTRQKGFDRLIDWLRGLQAPWHLTLLGDGPDRRALEEATGGLPVRFTGFLADPAPLLAGADAFLLPSRWEGMPNAALEALALGTPVIAMAEAGAIDEVAADAAPGAVTLAADGDAFLAAAASAIVAEANQAPRPSLLPPSYRRAEVAVAFLRLLIDRDAQR